MDREAIDSFIDSLTRKRPKPINCPGMRTVCDKRSSSFRLPAELATGVIPIFAMLLPKIIMGPSRPWSDRYLFSALNAFQRLSMWEVLTALKRVELLSPVTFRISLEGRSTRSVGRESHGLKRSVRVQAYLLKLSGELVC